MKCRWGGRSRRRFLGELENSGKERERERGDFCTCGESDRGVVEG